MKHSKLILSFSSHAAKGQKLPSISTTALIRYKMQEDCSVEFWEGVFLRKSEQHHVPYSLLISPSVYSSLWPVGRGQSVIGRYLICTMSVSTRQGWEVAACCRQSFCSSKIWTRQTFKLQFAMPMGRDEAPQFSFVSSRSGA